MSIYHATLDTHDHQLSIPLNAAIDAVSTARSILVTAAGAVRTAIARQWTQRRLTRLSDRMLRDFGFEREWDGSIRSLRNVD